jgi:hypothetical protein
MMRFDERRLKHKDGDDFRDFVSEFLRASSGFGRPVPRDSGSVDGCIDLYCDQQGLVVECKFVGADVKDETGRVEQEWKNVRDKLDENLRSLDGAAAPSRAPYRPWADVTRPIKRYVFATSARLANEAKQRELATQIQNFFRANLGKRSGYQHLQLITVEVIDWTNITAQLVDHPALVFKWLKQWPEGFAELDDQSPTGFRAFFHSEKLSYLARDSWQPPHDLRHPWTETSLVEEITQPETRDPIVVLIGRGGVGKTRLGLECARRMRALGWRTIRCNGLLAETTGLRKLLEESPAPTRILLFVDYLETWPTFEGFASDVIELNQSSGHAIRIIATCRASYRDRLATFMKVLNIGGEARIEAAYSEAVTRHILSKIGAVDIDALVEKCRSNFALAAFLAFLRHERPDAFAVELSELAQEPDFEAWIIRRLQNAGLKEINAVAAILAACDFRVTAFDDLAEAHSGSAIDLRRILIADKWIERRDPAESSESGPVWAAFHDIFADVVLARALDRASDRNDAIDRLLELAVANSVFRQTFTALGRLKQIETLATVDWRARLLELERRKPHTLAEYARLLLANALLTPEARLALIDSNGALEKAIASDPSCDLGLALTAAALSPTLADASPRIEFHRTIIPLLDIAIARSRQKNIILRLGFRARPERYREVVLSWIIAHPDSFQTHFLLKGWLDEAVAELKVGAPGATAHIEAVGVSVTAWLEAHATSTHATFVLAAWLNAAAAIKGEIAAEIVARVADYVTEWLAYGDHATSDETRFVYTSWLNAAAAIKGEGASDLIATVADHMEAWLARGDHATRDETQFVYRSWLNAATAIKGEGASDLIARVADHMEAWLAHGDHATSDDAEFVYTGWLNTAAVIKGSGAADMVTRVTDRVAAWLARGDRATSDEAQFIYTSWLDTAAAIKGDGAADMVTRVTDRVAAWLAYGDHATSDEAQFIFTSWLNTAAAIKGNGAAEMVKSVAGHVTAWLADDDHATSDEAQFIFTSWLNTAAAIRGDGAVDMVKSVGDRVAAWLAYGDHATSDDARFLYASWLSVAAEIKGDVAAGMVRKVTDHLTNWLNHNDHADSEKAGFVYGNWLEAAEGAQLRQFFGEILNWIVVHQDDDCCEFVLEPWLDRGLEFDPVANTCFSIVRRSYDDPNATFILKHVVRQEKLPEDVVFAALCWCSLFPDHEDALNRLGPLLDVDREIIVGSARLTRVAAKVLLHLKVEALLADPFKLAAARAVLGSLFNMGKNFAPSEKLARVYFVRWLRDGRVFCPATHGQRHPAFDQRLSLAEPLLTVLEHGEFVPWTNAEDNLVITQFCQWVSEWESLNVYGIAGLIDEMSDRFGMPNLWQQMLPKTPFELNDAINELPNPFLRRD